MSEQGPVEMKQLVEVSSRGDECCQEKEKVEGIRDI